MAAAAGKGLAAVNGRLTTVFVRNLPATADGERLGEIYSELGPIKHCFVVKEKGSQTCRGFGYVTFSLPADARKALKEAKFYDGQKLSVSLAKKKLLGKKAATKEASKANTKQQAQKKLQRKARLIVRNLSFKCSEDDLKTLFSQYGTVLEVHIPRKEDGKMRGFAFVQLKNLLEAGKALKGMNLKEIKGRPVAVDWAVAKDKYSTTVNLKSAGAESKDAVQASDKNDECQQEDGMDSGDETEKEAAKESKVMQQQNVVSKKRSATKEEKVVIEASDDETDDEEDASDEDASDEDASDEDASNEEVSEDDEEDEKPVKKKKLRKASHPVDVHEGRTIFIRNLSFDTEEDTLGEMLEQFGDLKYVCVVRHPDTEHSKGCAFAQFVTKESVQKCVEAAESQSESGGLQLDGRKLIVTLAISREEAKKLTQKKSKKPSGTRNLYLAREGLIRAGMKSAEGMSAADIAKRTRFEELKRQKLKDVNIFVSKTRLCVHNIPKSLTDQQLRKLCLEAAGTKDARVKECRIMRDLQTAKTKGSGRSLGYGFVEFTEHSHSLTALRALNNNPDTFGPEKRPIVEFSLEDRRKLKIKEMRMQRNLLQQLKVGASKPVQTEKRSTYSSVQQQTTPQTVPKDHRSWSGFCTTPEVEEVELANGKKRKKVLPLPSHRGPKIRKRDKGKQQQAQTKKVKMQPGRAKRVKNSVVVKQALSKKQVAKSNKRNKEEKRFNSLVEQYKKKLLGTVPASYPMKKSKWFQD
ncbi:RNA-binding protein 28 isoform X2 [Stegostoma tigrinum]|uniref:RNA-binding protein 28 isoform X2 n=1 Tax=Stegostoma tigrinum TaxID=3053191 RepID=UPI00202B6146|nr:RNA-binding protein 28 isoform X2 [Stegostoma tigrinum]